MFRPHRRPTISPSQNVMEERNERVLSRYTSIHLLHTASSELADVVGPGGGMMTTTVGLPYPMNERPNGRTNGRMGEWTGH